MGMSVRVMVIGLIVASCSWAQSAPWYAGAGPGISTLSGDARSVITPQSTAISQYKPENGPLVHLLGGKHVREYVSVQGVYSWNRNALALVGTRTAAGVETTYEQARRSRQHNAAGDVLIYFQGRASSVRTFLSVGLGVMSFASDAVSVRMSKGAPVLPPARFTAMKPGLRVAAGMDWLPGNDTWGVRYAFLETIQDNPISP